MPADPFRQSYLFLPWYAPAVVYSTFFVCGLIMLYGIHRHLRGYGLGLGQFLPLATKDLSRTVSRFLKFGVGQRKVVRSDSGGVMHGALFYGFLMLFAYTTLIFIQTDIIPLFTTFVFLQGSFYLALEFLGDTLGIAFIVGLAIAVFRRYVQKLEKLETRWDDYLVLTMLIWIGISGFLIEALRFLAIHTDWAVFSPVGDLLASGISVLNLAGVPDPRSIYQALWWAHMFSVFALIAVTPYTKLVHVFTSAANVALAPEKPIGRLNTPFSLSKMMAAESGSFEMPPNAKKVTDFSPVQLLALDACTNCGRCQEVCPAYAAGRDLSPRLVVRDLGGELFQNPSEDVLAAGVIRENEMWACTTCNACVAACPVLINQVDYIAEFRRTLVAENKLDPMKKTFLENVGRNNNPFGLPQGERQTWLADAGAPTVEENPGAEYIYWIGCQASYDPRARSIARSVIKVMRAAGVSFAVLGNEEVCTGEPVRRMGEEARFQELALKNIETIHRKGGLLKTVVTHCPHCFNTFLNEYPEFGAKFKVVHHSQLLSELAAAGRIPRGRAEGGNSKVTFHDPCNLGRINGEFDAPRNVLASRDGVEVIEMKRNKMNSFCCGGGGANVWYQVPEKKKIGVIRVEEAKETGADVLAVACPFCITMFEDAAKTIGDDSFAVKDIAEILAEGLPDERKSTG